MSLETLIIKTDFGDVALSNLVAQYVSAKEYIERTKEARREYQRRYVKTPEGKKKNYENALAYYHAHKDEISAKRKAKYAEKKAKEEATPPA